MLQFASLLRRPFTTTLKGFRTNWKLGACRISTETPINIDMETVNTTERLRSLRELMQEHKVDVYSIVYPATFFFGQYS